MTKMPTLETPRLWIRPFVMEDLPDVYQLLDVELREAQLGTERIESLGDRAQWLQWSMLNYEQLAKSMGVMRKLGMRIERNPLAGPPWLQVVGILERA